MLSIERQWPVSRQRERGDANLTLMPALCGPWKWIVSVLWGIA